MNKQDILTYLKEIKPSLEKEGIISLGLFGSYAKDDERENSDIDILVETSDKFINKYIGWEAFTRLEEIKEDISNKFHKDVDMFDKNSPDTRVKEFILKNVIYV
jgi:predicted nucleotidyltransferase